MELFPADCRHELAIVSYPGTGRYTDTTIFIPYQDLPDTLDVATDEQKKIINPEGQSWWPVILLQTEPVNCPIAKVKKVLVVCFYQILSNGRTIAWWIYL